MLGVAVSGYYRWLIARPSESTIRHAWLTDVIRQVHAGSRGAYGSDVSTPRQQCNQSDHRPWVVMRLALAASAGALRLTLVLQAPSLPPMLS